MPPRLTNISNQVAISQGYNFATTNSWRFLVKKLVALTTLALAFTTAGAYAESFKGFVSDSMCAAKGNKNSADCAAKCIKGGSAPVLVVGDKVYKITNPDTLVPHAGHDVTVEGTLKGDSLTVESVKM
jgi:hypothetical protein